MSRYLGNFLGACALSTILCLASVQAKPLVLISNASNAVATWHDLAAATFIADDAAKVTPSEKQPLLYADMTTVTLAMYNAASAVDGRYEPFGVAARLPERAASIDAAVGAAAYGVLHELFPSRGAHYQAAYDSFVAALPKGQATERGLVVGAEAARAILAKRAVDGRDTVLAPYVKGTAVGKYQGEKAMFMVAPSIRPFTLERLDQFRPGPPPALTSATYAADFNETKALGSSTSTQRTADQSQAALFNTEAPATWVTRSLGQLARSTADPAEAARVLAAAYVVNADAILACFEAKYFYNAWRPYTAIALADQDDNPATVADPAWRPFQVTPQHPEYPAGHSCAAGALAGVLRNVYGTNDVSFALYSSASGTSRSFGSIDEYLREAATARVAGGMHFRFSTVAGQKLGGDVADYAMQRHFGRRK